MKLESGLETSLPKVNLEHSPFLPWYRKMNSNSAFWFVLRIRKPQQQNSKKETRAILRLRKLGLGLWTEIEEMKIGVFWEKS